MSHIIPDAQTSAEHLNVNISEHHDLTGWKVIANYRARAYRPVVKQLSTIEFMIIVVKIRPALSFLTFPSHISRFDSDNIVDHFFKSCEQAARSESDSSLLDPVVRNCLI